MRVTSMLSAAALNAHHSTRALVPSAAAAALATPRPLLRHRQTHMQQQGDADRRTLAARASGGGGGGPASSSPQQLPLDPILPPELAAHYRPNVAAVVVNSEGRVFAARRVDDPNPDSLQFPQGGVDPGESPEEAAVRVRVKGRSRFALCCNRQCLAHCISHAHQNQHNQPTQNQHTRTKIPHHAPLTTKTHAPKPYKPRSCTRRRRCARSRSSASSPDG